MSVAGAPEDEESVGTFVTTDGVTLRVATSGGAEGPTLVLVHGWTQDLRTWDRVVDDLRAAGHRGRVVRHDHRGHGGSDSAPEGTATLERIADDVAELLAERVPEGPVVLAGHSMGGMALVALAERHPDLVASRVRGVALVATAADDMAELTLGLPGRRGRLVAQLDHALAPWVAALGHRAPRGRIGSGGTAPSRRSGKIRRRAALLAPTTRALVFGRHARAADVASVAEQLLAADPGERRRLQGLHRRAPPPARAARAAHHTGGRARGRPRPALPAAPRPRDRRRAPRRRARPVPGGGPHAHLRARRRGHRAPARAAGRRRVRPRSAPIPRSRRPPVSLPEPSEVHLGSHAEVPPEFHEVVVVGTGFAGLGQALAVRRVGIEDVRPAREGAGGRRGHVAREHLSRLRVRHPVAHVLAVERPQPALVALVLAATGDPGVPRGRRRPPPAAREGPFRRRDDRRHLGRGLPDVDGAHRRGPGPPLPVPRLRRRWSAPAVGPDTARRRAFRRARVPLGAVAPRRRPAREAGRRDRHGRERGAVRPADRADAASVTLYQRTPAWVLPKNDHPIPAARQRLFARVPGVLRAYRAALYGALDARATAFMAHPALVRPLERAARRHIERSITDPDLVDRLTPRYSIGCKRVLVSDDYYPTLARDDVEVVSAGVREVREGSVVDADGVERAADVIVYGTGFHVTDAFDHLAITGRDGRRLAAQWAERGSETHLGITVADFPNLFLLLGPNTALGHQSVVFMIECQARYVAQAITAVRGAGASGLDVRTSVQQRFQADIRRRLERGIWTRGGCTSWYLDAEGVNRTIWPGFTTRYWWATRRFRAEDYEFFGRASDTAPAERAA